MPQDSAQPFSLTCQTDDEAVYYCLLALRRWAEGASPEEPAGSDGVDAWRARGGEVVLRFASERARGAFLGEATRLLSGKWLRLGAG